MPWVFLQKRRGAGGGRGEAPGRVAVPGVSGVAATLQHAGAPEGAHPVATRKAALLPCACFDDVLLGWTLTLYCVSVLHVTFWLTPSEGTRCDRVHRAPATGRQATMFQRCSRRGASGSRRWTRTGAPPSARPWSAPWAAAALTSRCPSRANDFSSTPALCNV